MSKRTWMLAIMLGLAGWALAVQADQPKKLKVALITNTTVEEPWNTAAIQAFDRIIALKPHGLDVELKVQENVAMTDGERVLRTYAQTGEYGIIWCQGQYPDAVEALHEDFPEICWVEAGSAYKPLGGNVYWVQMYVHEPAYLLGMLAGMITENDTIGAVAAYPFPNVNLPINGYLRGALAVNPNAKMKMTYIDSWFDPARAKESALAQISSGADVIYAERFGPFEACVDKDVYAFGHYVDQSPLAPEVVLGSTLALWDPAILYIVDAWWEREVDGKEYDGPMKEVVFSMAEGGSGVAISEALSAKLPEGVMARFEEAKQSIMDGSLKVPFSEKQVLSD
ncbi:MAG: BMP family protein [Kiritimatiellae bacterium]|nr:BMP family protein [Kiritimatiellia bacterium]MDD4736972.1 BMP family protein [Kiritimatiellia bacterium]